MYRYRFLVFFFKDAAYDYERVKQGAFYAKKTPRALGGPFLLDAPIYVIYCDKYICHVVLVLFLLRMDVPAEQEHRYAIVCLEYTVTAPTKCFWTVSAISEGEILYVEKPLTKLTSLLRQIGQQQYSRSLKLM